MYSKILRKLYNLILIPITFKNWIRVIFYAFVMYFPRLAHRYKTGLVVLRTGQMIKIGLTNVYDLGNVIEVFQKKDYIPAVIKIPDNAKVIDIGASVGDFSIFCASSFKNCKCFSFEPRQSAFDLMKENILANRLGDRIKACPLALSAKGGKIKIGDNTNNSTSLEDVFKDNGIDRCDLLKMDIEGMEYEVLFNTKKEIMQRIGAITMECHVYDNGENLSKLVQYLTKENFNCITTKVNAYKVCYLYAYR